MKNVLFLGLFLLAALAFTTPELLANENDDVVLEDTAGEEIAVKESAKEENPASSKASKLKQKRLTLEEMSKNVLETELEKQRIEDEKARLKKILNSASKEESKEESNTEVKTIIEPKQETTVTTQIAQVAPMVAAHQPILQPEMEVKASEKEESMAEKISIAPNFGLSTYKGRYDDYIESTFSAGVALDFQIINSFSIEGMWSNSQYSQRYEYAYYPTHSNLTRMDNLNQNIYGLNGKFYLTRKKVAPFIGGGFSYNDNTYTLLDRFKRSYELDTQYWGGILTGGVDVNITKNASIGARVNYIRTIEDRDETNRLAFNYGPGYYEDDDIIQGQVNFKLSF